MTTSPGSRRAAVLFVLLGFAFPAAAALAPAGAAEGEPRMLSFAQRVAAQEAIERVAFSRRQGTRRSFEQAVPPELLERRVREDLARSAALEQRWGIAVNAELLRAELQRMAHSSRSSAGLLALFEALGHDAFLIQECLVRPIVVERLILRAFGRDATIHGEARRRVLALREALRSGTLDPRVEHPARTVVELVPTERPARERERSLSRSRPDRTPRLALGDAAFDRYRTTAVEMSRSIGPLNERLEAFDFRVVLEAGPDRVRLARYSVRKRSWESWWPEIEERFDALAVEPVASPSVVLPHPISTRETGSEGDQSCPEWSAALPGPLDGRYGHTAVWTGNEMIVWGGDDLSAVVGTGARYDPATDSWSATRLTGAPSPRSGHSAVWTGDEMVVWGGLDAGFLGTGARYDPTTDSWTPTGASGAPSARTAHTAVWTGDEMIVWGGHPTDPPSVAAVGGRYDPLTDSWASTSPLDAPEGRALHTAVWTGSEMIVWGGQGWDFELDSGAHYNPTGDSWKATPLSDAPSPREWHTAVWTGSEMIVWGGRGPGGYFDTGARYDPSARGWTAMTDVDAPAPRYLSAAVWTGREMVVWGGSGGAGSFLGTGGNYDPAADSWTANDPGGTPAPRDWHTAVWTGSEMIVWGGLIDSATSTNSGGRYVAGVNVDDDADGLSECAGDCDDADGQIWANPGAVQDLRFVDKQSLSWSPPLEAGGSSAVYDLLRSDLRSDFDAAVCIESDDGADTLASDAGPPPAIGEAFYYQVRAENGCPGAPLSGASCP